MLEIRPAAKGDDAAIWSIMELILRAGETYALPPDMTKVDGLHYWTDRDRETFVAEEDGNVIGTYYIRANQMGGGSHVANCGYMTHIAARGRGVARAMCEHSLAHARERGFHAMQFNLVVSTNEPAICLWQSLGFDIVGRLPLAFRRPSGDYVDAMVMFRPL
jgi:ribosomal protein S18 acetylase RimI-like enzyme